MTARSYRTLSHAPASEPDWAALAQAASDDLTATERQVTSELFAPLLALYR